MRRLRGAVGTAILWAAAWAVIGVLVTSMSPTESGARRGLESLLQAALGWATGGTLGGLAFALCLATDGRRELRALSLPRLALWGMVSGAIVPVAMHAGRALASDWQPSPYHLWQVVQFALCGAACAVAAVVVARQDGGPDGADDPGSDAGALAAGAVPNGRRTPERPTEPEFVRRS